ncbi:MurR/RpiR family transcriptional regulator [Heyndrickxia acidicola]|uniref:SIS domain-containing protein n=1 Tax=Heyndrickxia acidicola TaxID=209389 RepID=A0ABU6MH10_9BACI|nr:SIS domain-containing protein [Heyndrickxia acidicola]MED1203959.1 SIS domain-containing protein [Heyndrickxia acidicola]
MININVNKLNPLEFSVHHKLSKMIKINDKIKILEAADECDVSPSKVSKLVRKLGFENFKQYKQFFSGQEIMPETQDNSTELERLKSFIESFDYELVDQFLTIFKKFSRIVLFGLGPSFICVEYLAYKLALISEKNIFAAQSEMYAQHLVNEDTLLIIFSVTGKFTSFENLLHDVKSRGAETLLILEEYNNSLNGEIDNIFYLTNSTQNENLLPFEKTRTVFFIFIEEIIAKLMSERHTNPQ